MSNVISIHPYQVLGRMEERIDRITAHALTHSESDILLYHVKELQKLSEAMRRSLDELQRVRLTEQLEASLRMEAVPLKPEAMRREQKP